MQSHHQRRHYSLKSKARPLSPGTTGVETQIKFIINTFIARSMQVLLGPRESVIRIHLISCGYDDAVPPFECRQPAGNAHCQMVSQARGHQASTQIKLDSDIFACILGLGGCCCCCLPPFSIRCMIAPTTKFP